MEVPCVGLIANPASGHDMRRLISGASVFTNTEKVHVVRRLLIRTGSALGLYGIRRWFASWRSPSPNRTPWAYPLSLDANGSAMISSINR